MKAFLTSTQRIQACCLSSEPSLYFTFWEIMWPGFILSLLPLLKGCFQVMLFLLQQQSDTLGSISAMLRSCVTQSTRCSFLGYGVPSKPPGLNYRGVSYTILLFCMVLDNFHWNTHKLYSFWCNKKKKNPEEGLGLLKILIPVGWQ